MQGARMDGNCTGGVPAALARPQAGTQQRGAQCAHLCLQLPELAVSAQHKKGRPRCQLRGICRLK